MTRFFQQCGMCDQQRLRPGCAYAQTDQSLRLSLKYTMSVNLLAEQHLEFLSFRGDCIGSSDSIHVKMPHCWKSHVTAVYMYTTYENSKAEQHQQIPRKCRAHLQGNTPTCYVTMIHCYNVVFNICESQYGHLP